MTIMIEIVVMGVDAKCRSLTTQDPSEALQFLKNHDHEGASINLIVEVDMDDYYTVLESLVKEK